jgi:lipopolysaccharide export system protein LptC
MIRAGDAALLGLLLLLFAISAWLSHSLEEPHSEAAPEFLPDHVMENIVLRQYQAEGHLASQLHAAHMRYYATAHNTELEQPTLVWYENDIPLWHVDAERGEISPDGETLYFLGAVHLRRHSADGSLHAEVFSRDIRFNTTTSSAETQATALIRTPNGNEIRGTGLFMENATRRLELHAEVHSIYYPK